MTCRIGGAKTRAVIGVSWEALVGPGSYSVAWLRVRWDAAFQVDEAAMAAG